MSTKNPSAGLVPDRWGRAQGSRVVGPGASAIKYDILTALLVTAARGDAVDARLALRLSLVITARYSWRSEVFAVGQRELARMWGVTERTAKREIAALRARGWISVSVPAARGRVAKYAIHMDAVLQATAPHWDAVGPDFAARMCQAPEPAETPNDNVVPLRAATAPPGEDGTIWPHASAILLRQDPDVYSAWLSGLVYADVEAGRLILTAPSPFVAGYVETHFKHRIIGACVQIDPDIRDLRIVPATS